MPVETKFDRSLGWRQSLEDQVHLQLDATPFCPPRQFRAPQRIDPRGWLKIEDQGRMGSCSGQAMSTCLELINWFETGGQVVQLSRMFAYLAAQKIDGLLGRDSGATISGAVKAARQWGICREATFPYPNRYIAEIPEPATKEAAKHRLVSHSSLSTYEEVFRFLATGAGAVEIGIPWRASLADSRGVVEVASGANYGGHAVAIVGYVPDRRDHLGRKYLIMANSHGRDWGENGFSLIAPNLFDRWGRDNYSEMIGVSDLHEFKPRRVDWVEESPWV